MGCFIIILGWVIGSAIGGSLGGGIGIIIALILSNIISPPKIRVTRQSFGYHSYNQKDFTEALLILTADVVKADGRFVKSELDFIKRYFLQTMGAQKAQEALLRLREILEENYNIGAVCAELRQDANIHERLLILQFLFGVAAADGQIDTSEINKIQQISDACGIGRGDYESIKAMFMGGSYYHQTGYDNYNSGSSSNYQSRYYSHTLDDDYKILEVSPDATDEEVKKAYRTLAKKYHPDRVNHLGNDMRKAAEEKFTRLGQAYDNIKKARGLK